MKNRRPILPIALLLIAFTAVLLFVLSKQTPSYSVSKETIDDTAALTESTAPRPVENDSVSGEKSTGGDTINQLNAEIASLADGETFFYIDANPLFDDGNGALDPQYCSDDLHPYGKYYYQWAEWLYEIGIPKA